MPEDWLTRQNRAKARLANREEKTEYCREYYQDNKEAIKESKLKYYQEHKEEIRAKAIETRKVKANNTPPKPEHSDTYSTKYYQEHKEQEQARVKKYKEENSERLNAIVFCECGGHHVFREKARHDKSKKHQKYLEQATTTNILEHILI